MLGSVTVIGVGPGAEEHITPLARRALARSDAVVGYRYYFRFVEGLIPERCERIEMELSEERDRAAAALKIAGGGGNVSVISSGDSGIYGMASVVHSVAEEQSNTADISVVPGISAFVAAAAKLGAPLGHDFCSISLSDLLTPWEKIEKRIAAAADGDFVTVIHNPRSRKRYWQLAHLKEMFLAAKGPDIPVGIVRHVSRDGEDVRVTTLGLLDPKEADMFTVLIVGNCETFTAGGIMVTPRGVGNGGTETAASIYERSFKAVERGLRDGPKRSPSAEAAVKRCVHTTADFEYERLFHCSDGAIEKWSGEIVGAEIVTDVTMVAAGISKSLLEKANAKVLCYLDSPESLEIAAREGITRSQAAMRVAVSKHPDALFAVGNAPTALVEIADVLSRGGFHPMGVVAAPVGFVNVEQSKARLEAAAGDTPFVVIRGKKGGSAVAAAIVNAALGFGR